MDCVSDTWQSIFWNSGIKFANEEDCENYKEVFLNDQECYESDLENECNISDLTNDGNVDREDNNINLDVNSFVEVEINDDEYVVDYSDDEIVEEQEDLSYVDIIDTNINAEKRCDYLNVYFSDDEFWIVPL